MQYIIQGPIPASRPAHTGTHRIYSIGMVTNGLLLLVSIPAAAITCLVLLAMLSVRFFGTLLK